MEDIQTLKSNLADYARSSKAVEVLRNANGKRHYTEIATIINTHKTTVSGLLKKAFSLGLATRNEKGNYKRKSGIMGYIPKSTKNTNKNIVVDDLIKKISKGNISRKQATTTTFPLPKSFLNSVDKMSDAYKNLYIVENTLRELIRKVFKSKTDWWKNNIPTGVQNDAEKTIKDTPYHAALRMDKLEYTQLGHLKDIIINKKNWNDFRPYLNEKDKTDFSLTIKRAIASRNAIGHCIRLTSEDLKFINMRLIDILKMIKS